MDFNEINPLKHNIIQEPSKVVKPDEYSVDSSQQNTENVKLPSNPNYWQHSVGIKHKAVSFCANNNDLVDDSYIDKKLAEMQCRFHYVPPEQLSNEHRENLQSLKPYGKKAVDNYAEIISHTHLSFANPDVSQKFKTLVSDFVKTVPDLSENYTWSISDSLLKASDAHVDIENIKEIIRTIFAKSELSEPEKIIHFAQIVNEIQEYDDAQVSEYIREYETMIAAYHNLITSLDIKEDEKDSYMNRRVYKNSFEYLSPGQMNNIADFIQSGKISASDFKFFIEQDINMVLKSQADDFFNKVFESDENLQLFADLINHSLFNYTPGGQDILEVLNLDVSFINGLFSKLKEDSMNAQTSDGYVFYSYRDLSEFLKNVNKSNIDDFFSVYKGTNAADAVYDSSHYLNAKTGLFDKRIIDKKTELENRGVAKEYSIPSAAACIDSQTGNFSPIAENLLDFLYPVHQKGVAGSIKSLKNSIKNRYITKSRIDFFSDTANPCYLIDALKNNNGSFEQLNLDYVYKIIKMLSRTYSYCSSPSDEIVYIMKTIKDENGVVDKDKFDRFTFFCKKCSSGNNAINMMKSLDVFPAEKQSEVFDTCMQLCQNCDNSISNFSELCEYCFDKEGNTIQSNIDYVKKLLEIKSDIIFSASFFDLCNNADMRDFILQMMKHLTDSVYIYELDTVINNYKQENGELPEFVKDKMLEYVKSGGNVNGFKDVFDRCLNQNTEICSDGFNNDLFDKVISFRKLEKNTVHGNNAFRGSQYIDIVNGNFKANEINFNQRADILHELSKLKDYVEKNNISGFEYLEQAVSVLEKSLKLEDIALPIDKESKSNFIDKILFSKTEEYTKFEDTMLKSIPLLESLNTGLPLKYSRSEFLQDLTAICQSDEDLAILSDKAGITPIIQKNEGRKTITGYDGLIKLSDLDTNNPKEKQIFELMHKFMYQNQVNTGNQELDEYLNIIIKACPEFINTMGKKQHGTHAYSLDIHSLLVMAYSINNPDYNLNLNELDKTLLKLTAIFHDIMKQENVIDKGHQNLSSLYTRSIIHKIFSSPEIQDRLFDLVDNHHWLEEYSVSADKETTAKKLAFKFRRPNDFEIAKIMADSDLKAVSESFYEGKKSSLSPDKMAVIQKYIDKLYSNGNALFSDYFVSPSALNKLVEVKDGKEYKVLNLHLISNDTDMGEYGFRNGVKKEDLRFLVHMVDNNNMYDNLKTVQLLSSPFNGGVLSESLISPDYKRTYGKRQFGVLLSQENMNVINECESNQGSGVQKGLSAVIDLIFSDYSLLYRNNFRNELLNNLGLSEANVSEKEYAEFFKDVLSGKTALSQIPDDRIYKIGANSITGKELSEAIKTYQDSLIDKSEERHNEIVGYIPKIQAVIAKAESLDKVPDDLLKFAYENNYPVILI